MIEFKKVKYKNFLSTGNSFVEIELDRSPTTLITGHNGAGKTTVLEAIIYCLYGKPYRKVKIANLVNNINKKKLHTEIEFEYQKSLYKVIRCQKPAKFEIYKDGDLIDQEAAAKDYQKHINRIFGDYKLFTQTVILNKSKFIPFLALSLPDRRKIVDDILDINVFTQMSTIARKLLSNAKVKIKDLEYEQDKIKSKMELTKNTISDLKDVDTSIVDSIRDKINELNEELIEITNELKIIEENLVPSRRAEISHYQKEINDVNVKARLLVDKIKSNEKELSFYKDNHDCPKCKQEITKETKDNILDLLLGENEAHKEKLKEYKNLIIGFEEAKFKFEKEEEAHKIYISDKNNLEYKKIQIEGNIEDKLDEIKKFENSNTEQLEKQEELLSSFKDELEKSEKSLKIALENQEVVETLVASLKDDGVKTKIVDMYVPILNEKINDYLEEMEFYIGVELDETFNEVFTAPGREGFSYHNLSDGQKSRLDLAILLAWLHVASLKASISTNLLFLDEILSAVDYDGINCFMNLIRVHFSDKNLFVIEQRQDLTDKFRSHMNFKLVDGFTLLE